MQIAHPTHSEAKLMYQIGCGLITLVVVLTVLFSILPFYLLGLHQQPQNLVTSGLFDPKGLAFYQTPLGTVAYIVGVVLYLAVPVSFAIFVPLILGSMIRSWRQLSYSWQVYGVLLLAFCAALA